MIRAMAGSARPSTGRGDRAGVPPRPSRQSQEVPMSANPSFPRWRGLGLGAIVLGVFGTAALADDYAPKPDERQLPYAMHSEMSERPTITVGRADADLIGADNRALQAAVDYVSGLGGGVVEIGEG